MTFPRRGNTLHKKEGAVMRRKQNKFLSLAGSCLIPLGVGGLSYLLTGKAAMNRYAGMPKPPLAPPGWVFPAVWSVLYVLMGVSAWRVGRRRDRRGVWGPYGLQLTLNCAWSPVFFHLGRPWAALGILGALEGCILWMIARFSRADRAAGRLQIPYALWVAFAGYLNFMIAKG